MVSMPCTGRSGPYPSAAVLLLCCLSPLTSADVPPEQKHEVAHLLSFVRYADCRMFRNGIAHDSRDGYRHVLEKYDYFRSRIQNTEDFIELAAARSLLSGEEYLVQCGDQRPEASAEWLRRELAGTAAARTTVHVIVLMRQTAKPGGAETSFRSVCDFST